MRSWMRVAIAVASLAFALAPFSATWAHGEKEATDPEDGARLSRPPGEVSVTLSEAPGPGSSFMVSDGCSRDVVAAVETDREANEVKGFLAAVIEGGEPGTWKARYRAISSIDGHETKDTFTFEVRGKRDCSSSKGEGKGQGSGDDAQIGGGEDTRIAGDEEESSFPIVPIAVGTVVLVGVALVLRRSSSG